VHAARLEAYDIGSIFHILTKKCAVTVKHHICQSYSICYALCILVLVYYVVHCIPHYVFIV
jgi:hypothetical protein